MLRSAASGFAPIAPLLQGEATGEIGVASYRSPNLSEVARLSHYSARSYIEGWA